MIIHRLAAFVLPVFLCALFAFAAPPAAKTRYQVVRDDAGIWWYQAPDGTRFFSLGINNISPEPYMPRPGTKFYNPVPTEFKGDLAAWGKWASDLLRTHNFNTVGAWSSGAIPTGKGIVSTPVLYVVEHEGTRCLSPLRPDFEQFVRANTRTAIAKIPKDADLLGVFLDNEMPWYGKSGWDDIATYTLLEQALELPAKDDRRVAAMKFLASRHSSVESFAKAYEVDIKSWDQITAELFKMNTTAAAMQDRTAFTAMLAEKFYETTTRIVREELPGTLILGTRIPGNAPDAVIRACGKYCDVMSLNEYRAEPSASEHSLTRFWLLGGKPIMHTEYSWRAKENASGNPNTRGAGSVVQTQADRGRNYQSIVSDIATVPYVIGSHWFEFADQSPQGRFDGEDSNYGVVSLNNKPYVELLSAMRETNARVHKLHGESKRIMPTEMPRPKGVTFVPGQHPGRQPKMDLLAPWVREPEIWGGAESKINWSRKDSTLVLEYDTGSQFGAGMNIFGPKSMAITRGPGNATDLDGYATVVLDLEAPKGVQMNLVLAEAGAAHPGAGAFDVSAGDDGEGFISLPFYGKGSRETYRIQLTDLTRQMFFGNQSGALRVDMQAIRNTGLQFSGSPRKGTVIVHAFYLER
ncbi:MAG: hypothetical protein K2W85_06115 [Phycisphaerales bacterium]|nr:hypothetical protein [Phycisphaerales bacterium]